MKHTQVYYEVTDNNSGGVIGKDGRYSFYTPTEAIQMVTEFKNNPRSHNPKMSDDNVKYWSSKTYTIVRKEIISEELQTI